MLDGRTADAIRIIREEKAPEEMIPAAKVMRLKVVEQVWTQAGNIQNAYETHKELHALNDSIQTANVRMQLSTRLMEYEHDKRLLEQQQEIEHSKMTNRLACSAVCDSTADCHLALCSLSDAPQERSYAGS